MAALLKSLLCVLIFVAPAAVAGEVEELRAQVGALQAELAQCRAAQANPPSTGPTEADETAARELYQAAQAASRDGDAKEAKRILDDLMTRYGNTRTASRATRLQRELNVVGSMAPPIEAEHWFGGEAGQWGPVTLVIFFETWCPHCRREVPRVNEVYRDTYRSRGLTVLGFTKVSRSSTEAKVRDFVTEQGIVFPIARETGSLTEAFAVSGIPAAAAIVRGEVGWRGHPGTLTADQIDQWLEEN